MYTCGSACGGDEAAAAGPHGERRKSGCGGREIGMCTHVGLLVVVMKHGLLQGLTVSEGKVAERENCMCKYVGLLVVVMKHELMQGLVVRILALYPLPGLVVHPLYSQRREGGGRWAKVVVGVVGACAYAGVLMQVCFYDVGLPAVVMKQELLQGLTVSQGKVVVEGLRLVLAITCGCACGGGEAWAAAGPHGEIPYAEHSTDTQGVFVRKELFWSVWLMTWWR